MRIQELPLFRGMSEEELSLCMESLKAREQSYKRGTRIMEAGHTAQKMGMVLTGSVTIESNDVWGNLTVLSHVGEGGSFAETYALVPRESMLVDVVANDTTQVLFLDVSGIGKFSGENREDVARWQYKLLENLLRISVRKNLTLSARSFHTAPRTIRGKVLSYLNAVSIQKQSREFDIPFDRQQLADYLNTERTALSKELSRMQADGLIRYRKNHFSLLQAE